MPSATQIVPEHDYAYTKVVVNDNSARPSDTVASANTTYCNMLFVFSSPKGIDNELQTLSGGQSEFEEKYGIGTYDLYGQPFLNAYAAARTNAATLHCLRVTADDAAYAVGALVAHYKATPGSTPEPPVPTPSDKVSVNGHENVLASDEVDVDGTVKITLAGTEVEPGISDANKAIFGDITGNYIDIDLDLVKILGTEGAAGIVFDEAKTYQITQVNPALALYDGKDEYIHLEDGRWTKRRTYAGADLVDGLAFLTNGVDTITFSIVEWGTEEVQTVSIENATDLGIRTADPEAAMVVSGVAPTYTVACDGEAVAGLLHPEMFGTPTGKNLEIELTLGGLIEAGKSYVIIQTNANLEQYKSDPTVKKDGNTYKKTKTYAYDDIVDGYVFLLGEGKGDVVVSVYDAEGFVSEADSSAIANVTFTNGYTFVDEHTKPEPEQGPVGETQTITVESAVSFVGTVARSAKLRAVAKSRAVLRAIQPVADEGPVVDPSMEIYYTFEAPADPVTNVSALGSLVEVDSTPDADGFTAVKVFEMACRGRGAWGNNVRFVLNSYARGDRLASYKNYTLSIYEIQDATMTKKEEFTVGFDPNAVDSSGNTLYADYIVSDPYDNSSYVNIVTNPTAMKELFAAYVNIMPDTSLNQYTFDPLTGMQFGTSLTTIDGLTIDTTSNKAIALTGASGVALKGGSDGAFAEGMPNRQAALNDAYLKAYSGEIDRNVRSKKMFPTDIILDANFENETKIAISNLVTERQDCVGIFDLGTQMNTFAALMENLADIEPYIASRSETIEGYYGKIQDPISFKIVPVTATYALAMMYPAHFQQNGGKHVPLAGSSYAVMQGFLSGTAWPVYDDDLDADVLDTLTESKVNFLKVNSVRQVVRGAQTTRQDADTNLSELSNVLVLNDIRRDAVQMCEQYEYNFAEASDLQRFNKAAGILADKYQDAQVQSISAEFSMNDWESERGILHLYIDFVHKNIIKRSIVEIDVNRGSVVS